MTEFILLDLICSIVLGFIQTEKIIQTTFFKGGKGGGGRPIYSCLPTHPHRHISSSPHLKISLSRISRKSHFFVLLTCFKWNICTHGDIKKISIAYFQQGERKPTKIETVQIEMEGRGKREREKGRLENKFWTVLNSVLTVKMHQLLLLLFVFEHLSRLHCYMGKRKGEKKKYHREKGKAEVFKIQAVVSSNIALYSFFQNFLLGKLYQTHHCTMIKHYLYNFIVIWKYRINICTLVFVCLCVSCVREQGTEKENTESASAKMSMVGTRTSFFLPLLFFFPVYLLCWTLFN